MDDPCHPARRILVKIRLPALKILRVVPVTYAIAKVLDFEAVIAKLRPTTLVASRPVAMRVPAWSNLEDGFANVLHNMEVYVAITHANR